MISKYKKINIKSILLGSILIFVIGGVGTVLNTSKSKVQAPVKTPTAVAEQFLKNINTVDAKKVADFKALNLQSTEAIDKDIQPLMTKGGYEDIIANQFNTLTTKFCVKGNYTSQVTDFTLGKNIYGEKDAKVRYRFEVKLKFTSDSGKSEQPDALEGAIELLKENGEWKVSTYDISKRPKIYNK